MPFEPFAPAAPVTTEPSLRILSEVLRVGPAHPLWPEGFEWRFYDCEKCAIGLSAHLWNEVHSQLYSRGGATLSDLAASWFSIPQKIAYDIFIIGGCELPSFSITPQHVADAIDAYLERVGAA